jgi:hypothetical protein
MPTQYDKLQEKGSTFFSTRCTALLKRASNAEPGLKTAGHIATKEKLGFGNGSRHNAFNLSNLKRRGLS